MLFSVMYLFTRLPAANAAIIVVCLHSRPNIGSARAGIAPAVVELQDLLIIEAALYVAERGVVIDSGLTIANRVRAIPFSVVVGAECWELPCGIAFI